MMLGRDHTWGDCRRGERAVDGTVTEHARLPVVVPLLARVTTLLGRRPLVISSHAVVEAGTVARVGHEARHAARRSTHVAAFVCTVRHFK